MSLRLPNWNDLSKEEQIPIINLPLNGTYLVTGGPGTGKTICALFRAGQVQVDDDDRIMFLVYNKTLYRFLDQAIDELGINNTNAKTWMSWLWGYLNNTIGKVPKLGPYKYDWDVIHEHLGDMVHIFDHLIVDEGQRIEKGLYYVLKQVSPAVTVFYDKNQTTDDNDGRAPVTQADLTNIFDAGRRVYFLTKNYRNTVEIADASHAFYTGDPGDFPANANRHGEKPKVVNSSSFNKTIGMISAHADNFPERNIGVLLPPTGRLVNKYFDALTEKCNEAVVQKYLSKSPDEFDFDQDGVKLMTYKSMVGLEFETVFVPEIDHNRLDNAGIHLRNEIYVACSRAKEDLFLVYESKKNNFIFEIINENSNLFDIVKP